MTAPDRTSGGDTHSIAIGYVCWLFGFMGAHRFYYGRQISGTIWFFTAGLLFGDHEGWPLHESMKLANACAAASLRSPSTTEAVVPWQECLALAEGWGWR